MKRIMIASAYIVCSVIIIGLSIALGILLTNNSSLILEITSLNSTIPYLSTKQIEYQSEIQDSTQTIEALGGIIDTKSTQLKNISSTQIAMIYDLNSLKDKVICKNSPIGIDFSSNSTVSKGLISWLEDIDGSNLTGSWDILWNNSKASIHNIKGKYLWVFIVYFKDEMFEENAIYSVQDGCFFDV